MANKLYTGPIDCLGAALPDEEYFVLLARDPIAPWIIAIWASLRVGNFAAATENFRLMFQGGLLQHYQAHPDTAKSEEATMVAQKMVDWRQGNLGGPGGTPTWKQSLVRAKMMTLDKPAQQICPMCQEFTCECEGKTLLRKVIVGLLQVTTDMAGYAGRDDLAGMSEDLGFALEAMGQYADRVNGYVAELQAAVEPICHEPVERPRIAAVEAAGDYETRIDSRTGRPLGDHGTANQAISFVTENEVTLGCSGGEFLRHWREGNLDDFPEFYTWLKEEEARG